MKKYKINKLPRYIHVSRELIDSVQNVYNYSNFVSSKPLVGLWYARGTEWIEFLSDDSDDSKIKIGRLYISTDYKIYKISIKKRVKISEKPNKIAILTISSFKQLSIFVDKFFIEDHKTPKGTVIKTRTGSHQLKWNRIRSGIEWDKVKKLYGGIEFKNYSKLLEITIRKMQNYNGDPYKYKYNWLSSYDVNGGVVWNSKAIKIDLISPDK